MHVLRKATKVLGAQIAFLRRSIPDGSFRPPMMFSLDRLACAYPDVNCRYLSTPLSETRRREGSEMKALANTAALLVALSVMGGLLLAQRGYQNSWREPSSEQASTTLVNNEATPQEVVAYKAVLK